MPLAERLRDWLDKLETLLDGALRRDAPVHMSESGRRWLAVNLWWIAVALGVLQLCGAWLLWRAAVRVERLVDFANSISVYGYDNPVSHLGVVFYFSLFMLAADGALLMCAYQHLQKFSKRGWDLLYYALLLNVVAGIVMVFSAYGAGLGDLVRSVLLSAVGAYFLFQVREYFTGVKDATKPARIDKANEKLLK